MKMPKKKLGPYQKAAKLSNDHFIETGVRIPANTIYARLRSGWSTTEAVLPVGTSRPSKKYGAAKKKSAAAKRRAAKKAAKQLELPLPEVKTPGEFQRVEHPPMGVKDNDRDAAMFLLVVGVIAAVVLAMAFGV